ncbi:TPA: hypothetical protein NJ348_004546 [Vibrio parahaemolyticus]|uniref:hypothetical protein n=1 Tax=Vibrio parahaemolyticus TaxID=670 RepID=UPI0010D08DA4|nr:hypothetical protein [Vibrio parahaemolyticus]EJR0963237.1 hypothetical protein [Vibrio parahaemolyticus]EKB1967615.1 hypothetical protein [Vibrio parahaemolyticus]ELA8093812.1 hypothetical protein [Vibrio parahaemolyticus]MBE4182950.1 hypothetical protein [Vibrio parahaemolyticus]MBE4408517.1 hypothetical protein [Vibrio parahaemolyticus]
MSSEQLQNDGFSIQKTITATIEGSKEQVDSAIAKADEKYTGVVYVDVKEVEPNLYKGTVTVIR